MPGNNERLDDCGLYLARKYARIFVRGHHLFLEAKTVSFEEQIMSKKKYPSIFSPQMEAIVFIILQILFATPAVSKIGEYSGILGLHCHVIQTQ